MAKRQKLTLRKQAQADDPNVIGTKSDGTPVYKPERQPYTVAQLLDQLQNVCLPGLDRLAQELDDLAIAVVNGEQDAAGAELEARREFERLTTWKDNLERAIAAMRRKERAAHKNPGSTPEIDKQYAKRKTIMVGRLRDPVLYDGADVRETAREIINLEFMPPTPPYWGQGDVGAVTNHAIEFEAQWWATTGNALIERLIQDYEATVRGLNGAVRTRLAEERAAIRERDERDMLAKGADVIGATNRARARARGYEMPVELGDKPIPPHVNGAG